MYKRYATLFVLFYLVIGTGWLCVQGIFVDKQAVKEAFMLVNDSSGEVLQATSYLGVTQEQVSTKRVLDMNVLIRKNRIEKIFILYPVQYYIGYQHLSFLILTTGFSLNYA